MLKNTETLTFNRMTSLPLWVIYWSWSTSLPSLMIVVPSVFQLLIEQEFCVKCHRDIDLFSGELNVNRGHLLIITKLRVKLNSFMSKRSQIINQTNCVCKQSPWPLTLWPQYHKRSSTSNGQTLRYTLPSPISQAELSWRSLQSVSIYILRVSGEHCVGDCAFSSMLPGMYVRIFI